MEAIEIIRAQVAAYDQHREHAVVTIVHSDGAARSHGKMQVYDDGATKGTVGGGAVERLAIRDALECIREGGSAFRTYDLNSPASEAGMACGGCTSVLIEAYAGRPLLVMCGAALAGALAKQASYVGMIGSAKKVAALFERLREKGVEQEALDRVFTPIGLDLGGETPEEIALAIMAEILMVKNGRGGAHLTGAGK